MKKLARMLFQRANGQLDVSRIVTLLFALAYVGESAYALTRGEPFDWRGFGIGTALLAAGGGAGVWMHGKSE